MSENLREAGIARAEIQDAVDAVNDAVQMEASETGCLTWYASVPGEYLVSHTVSDNVMSASYVATSGYGGAIRDGKVLFIIPTSWFAQYPTLGGTTVADWQTIAAGADVKTDASGAAMPVWQDYEAGTGPTNALLKSTAKIEMKNGAPVVTWSPDLNSNGTSRIYKIYGKESLENGVEWQYPTNSLHRFFRVTVEMP